MNDARTEQGDILVFDEALDAVGRRMMDATAAGLRLGMYDVVDDPRALDDVRMAHPIMLDPPEGSTDGQGRPLSSHDMASCVMLGKEISDAVRSEGLDPIVVATQALEGRLAAAGDDRRIEARATAIATTIVPEGTKGNTYVCMRTPWPPS